VFKNILKGSLQVSYIKYYIYASKNDERENQACFSREDERSDNVMQTDICADKKYFPSAKVYSTEVDIYYGKCSYLLSVTQLHLYVK
jgi:hypothetical protein